MIISDLILKLKKSGYKLTTPRIEIIRKLTSTKPYSAQELFEILKRQGLDIDLVTAYRTLELFEDLGFIQKIQFEDNVARYELISEDEHHHHLICINCGNVEDVEVDEETLVNQIKIKSEFKIQRHALEFFGFCLKCQ